MLRAVQVRPPSTVLTMAQGFAGFVGSGGVDHILVDRRKAADLRWRLRREGNLGPCCAAVGGAEEAGAAADRTRPADGRGGEPDTAQIDRPNTFDRCLELLDQVVPPSSVCRIWPLLLTAHPISGVRKQMSS
jgi:hypothetical protein